METTAEPLVINGETYIPGTGHFAQYYKRDNAGPWLELRDGVMVKAKFPPRGPKWWQRVPKFWRVVLLIAFFGWAIPLGLLVSAYLSVSLEDGVDARVTSDAQVFADQIREENSSAEIDEFCGGIRGMYRGELVGELRAINPELTYDEAQVVADGYLIVCER